MDQANQVWFAGHLFGVPDPLLMVLILFDEFFLTFSLQAKYEEAS